MGSPGPATDLPEDLEAGAATPEQGGPQQGKKPVKRKKRSEVERLRDWTVNFIAQTQCPSSAF